MYTSIAKPYLSYGVITWWPRVQLDVSRKRLSKVQRLACLSITGALRTTPTASLEVILDLCPLHIFLKMEACRSLCRLNLVLKRRVCYSTGTDRSSAVQGLIDSIAGDLVGETDAILPKPLFGGRYECLITERDSWSQSVRP